VIRANGLDRHALEHIEEERRDIFTKAKSCGMELANAWRQDPKPPCRGGHDHSGSVKLRQR
jgi:hypothetical protein